MDWHGFVAHRRHSSVYTNYERHWFSRKHANHCFAHARNSEICRLQAGLHPRQNTIRCVPAKCIRPRKSNGEQAYFASVFDFLAGIAADLGSNHIPFAGSERLISARRGQSIGMLEWGPDGRSLCGVNVPLQTITSVQVGCPARARQPNGRRAAPHWAVLFHSKAAAWCTKQIAGFT